jgi:copper chaperone CopZ
MKNVIHTIVIGLMLSNWAFAEEHDMQDHQHNHNHKEMPTEPETPETETSNEGKDCEQKIALHVKGLVCDFCARSIEKVFKKKKVTGVDVDLANGLIEVYLSKDQTLDDASLQKMIKNSGYLLERIERGCNDE